MLSMNFEIIPTPPRKIMLATDMSCRCDRALDRAAASAREWQADLVVTTVVEDESLFSGGTNLPQDGEIDARNQLRNDLAAEGLNPLVRVRKGGVVDQLLDVAGEDDVELVITGIARNCWLQAVVLGSTVDGLMRRSRVPTLIVRNRVRGAYRRILVAGDISGQSCEILRTVLGWYPWAEVVFFHPVDVPNANLADIGADAVLESAGSEARAAAVSLVDGLNLPPGDRERVRIHCETGGPLEALGTYLARESFDLVTVGADSRGLLYEILVGSTAKQIVENISTDVLVVRTTASI